MATTEDFSNFCRWAQTFLMEMRGYSTADVTVHITPSHISCVVARYDDFQASADYDHRVHNGYDSDSYSAHDEGWQMQFRRFILDHKTREERELRFMFSRVGSVLEADAKDAFVSAAGRAFVQRLTEMRSEYAALLEAPRTTTKSHSETLKARIAHNDTHR